MNRPEIAEVQIGRCDGQLTRPLYSLLTISSTNLAVPDPEKKTLGKTIALAPLRAKKLLIFTVREPYYRSGILQDRPKPQN